MRRNWRTWIGFCLGLLLVLAAMAWVSVTALRLDAADAEARRQGAFEEAVRLALWRIDSAVGPLVSRESVRPHYVYKPFYPERSAYTRLFARIREGDVLVPSPLLHDAGAPYVLLHFQFGARGQLTSPQVPTGNMRDLAESHYTTQEQILRDEGRLMEIAGLVTPGQLLKRLDQSAVVVGPEAPPGDEPREQSQQARINQGEWAVRRRAAMSNQMESSGSAGLLHMDAAESMMRPVWVGQDLLLLRRIRLKEGDLLQGCWLDWRILRKHLTEGIRDLLPMARLRPVVKEPPASRAHMVAALPIRLEAGDRLGSSVAAGMPEPEDGLSPVQVSLIVAWIGVALGAGAVAMLLSGAMVLSERRAAFVSAVTHELRTPLTTFRMYTEMLAEGMVLDEPRRRQYLATLRVEAERLGHLVENVLAYARLERGTARGRIEALPMRDLLDRVRGRLSARATQARMDLLFEEEGDGDSLTVRADSSAVEQVLFNLVDNACKYAASANDRRIHVIAGRGPTGMAALRVCDHGPGIASDEARRLFRPFHKSARDAARSAPGVGLGLALSRRLARGMGGDLVIEPHKKDGGACFLLTLPIVTSRYT